MGLDPMLGMAVGGISLNHEIHSPISSDYPHLSLHQNHHLNGFSRAQPDDYMVLDLSTTSSLHSSSSVHSSHESDEGSDEGILLDDLDEEEGEEEEEVNSEGEHVERHTQLLSEAGDQGEGPGADGLGQFVHSSSGVSNAGILCNICHKMYSNKGTLRVHYKTVHLREMHKCKVPGCNMVFSSVRSRNRHSQNPNLHKNMPFSSIID